MHTNKRQKKRVGFVRFAEDPPASISPATNTPATTPHSGRRRFRPGQKVKVFPPLHVGLNVPAGVDAVVVRILPTSPLLALSLMDRQGWEGLPADVWYLVQCGTTGGQGDLEVHGSWLQPAKVLYTSTESECLRLSDLLWWYRGHGGLRMPLIQRRYCWRTQQLRELWKDLLAQ